MKNNRKLLIGVLTFVLLLLAACDDSSDDSSAKPDNQSDSNNAAESTDDNAANSDESAENGSDNMESENADANENDETPSNESTQDEENTSANDTGSLKEEYLKKLKETKKETDELINNPTDSSTYAMKNAEGKRFDIWDGLLNEVYQILEEQLPPEEMEQLRKEQREWIEYRDDTAKEASLEYEGGTHEQLEYTAVMNNLTEERCFELVEGYMK
ncbi:Uncharacterized conserved protein YecT, DUF1311 family [Oceanobacillus limi]|uniref:Uncharacterized conserved protein YecT, DUF1311 family n=1 Tax=Oceanobacillus limi TaxID=930131 RepID=A0A1I0GJT6_9BACI|nr:lysozyme inhibitor LprI family protein [Oceanobacillus limi]SET71208.1 Uncharacterized conserved protein YecT, DUF1311 family [Oceanobacillus limi]